MKKISYLMTLLCLLLAKQTFAASSLTQPKNTCLWLNGWSTAYDDTVPVSGTFGGITVGRDAAIGSIIGEEKILLINYSGYAYLNCYGNAILVGNNTAAAAPVDVVAQGYPGSAGKVFPTNIPGIGVMTRIKKFGDLTNSAFFPISQSIPASKYNYTPTIGVILVKTGEIEPGVHVVKSTSSLSTLQFKFLTSDFSITVTADNCSIASPGSTISVLMGNYSISDLNPTSFSQRFQIPLTNCTTGSAMSNIANVTFTPTGGSTIADGPNGILGLDSTSKATGIGIQILKEDNVTAFPLGVVNPAGAITPGETVLQFNARYIKTNNSPQPGSANAKANFTVSYK
ncbi:fimbrial protein [Erwiniaceae bacterium CAU 1747]